MSNQLDYLFWKYPGTGTRTTRDYDWAHEINKDIISLILGNTPLLFILSLRLNISQNKLVKILIMIFSELN